MITKINRDVAPAKAKSQSAGLATFLFEAIKLVLLGVATGGFVVAASAFVPPASAAETGAELFNWRGFVGGVLIDFINLIASGAVLLFFLSVPRGKSR